MTDSIDSQELLNTISEQGEIIEELRDALKEFMGKRVPIAIAKVPSNETGEVETTVICDDGSMWSQSCTGANWSREKDIPQPDQDGK